MLASGDFEVVPADHEQREDAHRISRTRPLLTSVESRLAPESLNNGRMSASSVVLTTVPALLQIQRRCDTQGAPKLWRRGASRVLRVNANKDREHLAHLGVDRSYRVVGDWGNGVLPKPSLPFIPLHPRRVSEFVEDKDRYVLVRNSVVGDCPEGLAIVEAARSKPRILLYRFLGYTLGRHV